MRFALESSAILAQAAFVGVTAKSLVTGLLGRPAMTLSGVDTPWPVLDSLNVGELLSNYLVPGPAGKATWNPLFSSALLLSALLQASLVANGTLATSGWIFSEEQLFQLLQATDALFSETRETLVQDLIQA